MEDILISSPLFDRSKSNQYYISIQLGLNGFSFCIIEPVSNKLVYLNHIPVDNLDEGDLNTIFQNNEVLKLAYLKVNVLVCTSEVTSVPLGLYHENDKKALLGLSHPLKDGDTLLSNVQQFSKMVHIFSLQEAIISALKYQYPNATFKHYQAFVTWKALQYEPIINQSRVFLSIWNKSFHMEVLKGENIEFMNDFKYDTIDDFLYFFLYAFKTLDLDPQKTTVTIHGKIFKHSILSAQLKKYISHIEFSSWPNNLNYSNGFMELPGHYFSNLCLLHLCE